MSASKLNRRELTAIVAGATALAATPALAAQPRMEKALAHCQEALKELKAANNNKGGHRVEAIQHLEYVIQEIKRGIAYAS
ncbi:hypothetical protein [Sinisalibacter aestuarii]|uniref:Twin-arginine translocation signal domain-containing protein n=1 Tax=Sinisalibacter aestuarii TaxID=2949426 RepID=A0ABQ5LVH4_9RHOB|nr:hypothetical protein [Sinisalibacter aestuarii]GKY88783.1 hypothetical protein STA1M1_26520 [Sinisalibacter aestuarii]